MNEEITKVNRPKYNLLTAIFARIWALWGGNNICYYFPYYLFALHGNQIGKRSKGNVVVYPYF